MSEQVFIKLYLDEDVSVLLASLLRARGFAAITTLESDNLGASDERQLEFATANASVLVTHNRVDFELLAKKYFLDEKTHCGIICATRRYPNEIAKRLFPILNSMTAGEMRDQIRYI